MQKVFNGACSWCHMIRRYPLIALYFAIVWGGIYVAMNPPVTPEASAHEAPTYYMQDK